tara:strand:+ start:502 stop:672 length:171 start_codon:yes stop_codon:yes gene_type:complete
MSSVGKNRSALEKFSVNSFEGRPSLIFSEHKKSKTWQNEVFFIGVFGPKSAWMIRF